MPGFQIWQGPEYRRVTQGSKYAIIWLKRTLICLNMSEFTIIDRVLSTSYTIHSATPFYKLVTAY